MPGLRARRREKARARHGQPASQTLAARGACASPPPQAQLDGPRHTVTAVPADTAWPGRLRRWAGGPGAAAAVQAVTAQTATAVFVASECATAATGCSRGPGPHRGQQVSVIQVESDPRAVGTARDRRARLSPPKSPTTCTPRWQSPGACATITDVVRPPSSGTWRRDLSAPQVLETETPSASPSSPPNEVRAANSQEGRIAFRTPDRGGTSGGGGSLSAATRLPAESRLRDISDEACAPPRPGRALETASLLTAPQSCIQLARDRPGLPPCPCVRIRGAQAPDARSQPAQTGLLPRGDADSNERHALGTSSWP